MQNIQRISLFFRLLFQTAFIILPLILVLFWWHAPKPLQFFDTGFWSFIQISYTDGIAILHPLSPATKIVGFLLCLIPVGFTEYVCYCLIQLFSRYEKAEIFTVLSVNYIKKTGMALLLSQLANPIYEALQTLNLTWGNGHGHRFITMSFGSTNMGVILMAMMTILIAWIMAEGCRLREEQQLTI
jgi:hypothetical protein